MADPRIAMLKAVPLFAECDDKQLAFIATQVDEVDFVAGRDLCREGASGGEFFVILTGTAEVRRQGRHLRELGPGDFFGEIALLDGGPRTATVTALGPMKCLVLSRGGFHNGTLPGEVEVYLGPTHGGAITSVDYEAVRRGEAHTLYLRSAGNGSWETNACSGSHVGAPTAEETSILGAGSAAAPSAPKD